MGYNTRYEVDATGFNEGDEAEYFLFKLNRATNYGFGGNASNGSVHLETDEIKWYEWKKDLTDLSKHFPHATIDVEGRGEESGDMWKARIRNGQSEVVNAIMTFPDFKELV